MPTYCECGYPYDDFKEIVTDQENDNILWECPGCGLRLTDEAFQQA